MSKIVLVAESGSDISPELAKKYGIYIVPMHVIFGDVTKDDGSFDPQEVIDYYDQTRGKVPKTSGSNAEDFNKAFDSIHAAYPDAQILYLGYSAVTTVSYASAQIAAEVRDYVHSIDTKLVTAGQAAAVIHVARMIQSHPDWDIDRVVREAEHVCERTHIGFLPRNLDFLRAGGRCTNATALIGNILHLVPLIDLKDGFLVATKKYRGRFSKVIEKMMDEYTEKYHFSREILWVGLTPGFSQEFRRVIQNTAERLGFRRIEWLMTGGVITTHGGVGAFCIAGHEEE